MSELSQPFSTLHEAALDMVHAYADMDDSDDKIMLLDGFEKALVGVATRFGGMRAAAYDIDTVMDILQGMGMTEEEAVEFFEFNIIGAWVGEGTPVFVQMPKPVDIRTS